MPVGGHHRRELGSTARPPQLHEKDKLESDINSNYRIYVALRKHLIPHSVSQAYGAEFN